MTESDAERDQIKAFDRERAWVTGGYLIERFVTQRLEATGRKPSQNELAELFYPGKTPKTGRGRVQKLRDGEYPLTTGELVHLIAQFQTYHHHQVGDRLTPEEILILLQKLTQLQPEEKQQLNLSIDLEALMLQQAVLNVNLYQSQSDHETILSLYKSSIGLAFNQDISSHFTEIRDLHDYIKKLVMKGGEGERSPSYLPLDLPVKHQEELIRKAQREIDRILLKCGLGQFQFQVPTVNQQVPTVNQQAQSAYIKQYLPPRFVQRLTQAVIENELLTDNFPIFIKTITVQKLGPFPLEVASTLQEPGLILGNLLKSGVTDTEISSQISYQHANRVTVYFYMRLPAHYKEQLPDIFGQLKSRDDKGLRIDFSLSSTGIGGTLSHVVKVINTILLADNESLKNEFFSIAHEILITQDVIQNNMPSPVWAHSLVKLCNIKTLTLAMDQSQASGKLRLYEEFAFGGQVGRGDYCGFDLLLCSANAALQARLRALHLTGIAPQKYLQALGHRIERLYLIQEARSYVESYPFSSVALESRLGTDLISTQNNPIDRNSPYSLFDACLSIIETHLDEGAYRRADPYLNRLYPSLNDLSEKGLNWIRWFGNSPPEEQKKEQKFEIFSGSFIIRFEICKAQYFYLIDCEQERTNDRSVFLPDSLPLDPGILVARAWEALNRAEQHLSVRLAKYLIINEVSQGIFHPHHHHLARIYFLRAKLLIFSPRQVPVEASRSPHFLPTDVNSGNQRDRLSAIHGGRLYLMEQARIYAASNGDEEQYACYTACQAWIYLMAAFAAETTLTIQLPKSSLKLTRTIGLAWAKRLRNHALISYADTGQRCYYQIKENSGLSDQLHPSFGNYRISPIPPIREILGEVNLGQQEADGVLSLDMSLLSVERRWCGSSHVDQASHKIYLFGTNSCYLFFARGLFHLCSDEFTTGSNEFEQFVETSTIALWQQKFYLASRLLNLSWAIADDGGQMRAADDGNYNIDRNFMSDTDLDGEIDPDVSSVRDLYPHRVTEIADLGRIFAGAALVLQLYTANTEQWEDLVRRFIWITNDFQSLERCQRPLTRQSLQGQTRYNGHLTPYIQACRQLLLAEHQLAQSQRSPNITSTEISTYRDRLISQLFAALSGITPTA